MYQGQEECGGGQSLPLTGGQQTQGLPALSQHRVSGSLGHSRVVTGENILVSWILQDLKRSPGCFFAHAILFNNTHGNLSLCGQTLLSKAGHPSLFIMIFMERLKIIAYS